MNIHACVMAVLAAIPSLPALAQGAGGATDAKALVPALRHESAFTDYQRDRERPRADWQAVNRAVEQAARPSAGHAHHGPRGAAK